MEELLNSVSVPAIVAVVYWIVNLIKYSTRNNERVLHFVPLISCFIGILCGTISFYFLPSFIPAENIIEAVIIGGASGLTATGFHQIIKQIEKASEEKVK